MKKSSSRLYHSFRMLTLCILVLFAREANAQSNFKGLWVVDHNIKAIDENTSGVVSIGKYESTWNIFNNHLFLNFDNKIKSDTLLLTYKNCECSKAYQQSNIKFPGINTVVAKCYYISEKELGIIYVNQKFVESVLKYVGSKMSKTEQTQIFPSKLYYFKL